jgi:hypothetical protein
MTMPIAERVARPFATEFPLVLCPISDDRTS